MFHCSNQCRQKKRRRTQKESLQHADGMPWSATIDCLVQTVDSWSALLRPLAHFDQNLVSKVDPHTVANESLIEHSFGFTHTKGQGHSQTVEEYIQSKRRISVDFQIKRCKTLFNQQCVKSKKLQEKAYEAMGEGRMIISFAELC